MWKIVRIDEADFGCEERMPGEPLLLLVTLENESGEIVSFEIPESYIDSNGLNEGDEWPEDLEAVDKRTQAILKQNAWMDNYYDAVSEIN